MDRPTSRGTGREVARGRPRMRATRRDSSGRWASARSGSTPLRVRRPRPAPSPARWTRPTSLCPRRTRLPSARQRVARRAARVRRDEHDRSRGRGGDRSAARRSVDMRRELDWQRDGADWPNREASRFVRAGGLRWHVQVLGSGPSILLVHGTGAASHSWRDVAPRLAERFTVLVPDLPGHGFTQRPARGGLSLPGMAQALSDLLEALGESPALAVGHSAGAAILCRMSLEGRISPESIVSVNGALLPFRGVAGRIFSPLAKLLTLNPIIPSVFAWRA